MTDAFLTDPLGELLPPLTTQEALVESNRCLNCYDAPCTHACPTHIDVPRFIKKISTGNLIGSAAAILESNLLGATCSRVCPVQELCEGACVLQHEHRPITIGRLQRFAMDAAASAGVFPVKMSSVGKGKIAVVGAGPAGLSCAGELAKLGYEVTVLEKRDLPGGLSTYGIITLREPKEIALYEVEMLSRLGVKVESGRELGCSLSLTELQKSYDAVFLALGLEASPNLGIPGEEHILDGLDYVERSKIRRSEVELGNHVAVIGAGNTAIDCATIAKRLGSNRVTVVYRRTDKEMTAYPHEYEFIKAEGVEFRFLSQPSRVLVEAGKVTGLECVLMQLGARDSSDRPIPTRISGSEFVLDVDLVVKAIGQEKPSLAKSLGLETERGYLKVNEDFQTNLPGVFAGGDCVRHRGAASTVMAVQDGKLAAAAIHKKLVNA
ncbi:MAG TPA: NAD(P)-dependent oxidoreductase [Fimbriimonadaceae bacterium]